MPALAVVLALLATVANAAALVLQRKAALDTARARGRRTVRLVDVAQRPAWLVGLLILGPALGLQAAALAVGTITLVQPIVVMGLPSTLLLGWLVLGGALRRYEWICVAAMSVGLVVLLSSLDPRGGDALGAGGWAWTVGSVLTFGVIGLAVLGARRGRPVTRAALFGVAAGVGSGFVAVIFKAISEAFLIDGVAGVVTTPQSYLILPAAPLAFLTLQYALGSGRLIASQPGVVLANPVLAVAWGVLVFGEDVRGGGALVGAALGAVVVSVSVFALSRSPLLASQGDPSRADTSGRHGRSLG